MDSQDVDWDKFKEEGLKKLEEYFLALEAKLHQIEQRRKKLIFSTCTVTASTMPGTCARSI